MRYIDPEIHPRLPGWRAVAPLAALLAATALAACSSSSPSGLSEHQMGLKLDAICTSENAKIAAVPRPTSTPGSTTPQELQLIDHYFASIEPFYAGAVSRVKALRPASSIKRQWQVLVVHLEAVHTAVSGMATAHSALASNQLQGQALIALRATNQTAGVLGATTCTSSS